MSGLDWFLTISLATLYFFCVITFCYLTFIKGRVLLGILGIFLPFLWLIGAVLPARRGSRYERNEQIRMQANVADYTR